jgi:GMP synthase (glutamine-hydrolysing)
MPKTAPNVLAVRHLDFEDLGLLHPLLTDRGYAVNYNDVAAHGVDEKAIAAADLVVVLGGPIGANDTDRYPLIALELAALDKRVEAGKPTLGICLGAQLLARVLGADVIAGHATEIGYSPLTLTEQGRRSCLRHLDGVDVLHWHNDRFEIPEGAEHLASTPICANQAFALGTHVLGLQFHLETDPGQLERWLVGHAGALAAAEIDPHTLRKQAANLGPQHRQQVSHAMEEWLDGLPRHS